jgi:hypothetical protein
MKHHDAKELFNKAKNLIKEKQLYFIEDVVAYLPISKATFYSYFPLNSYELNELKDELEINRVSLKISMRSKWYKSNSPALQMALMKLIANEEELRKLAMQFVKSENTNTEIDLSELTTEEIKNFLNGSE